MLSALLLAAFAVLSWLVGRSRMLALAPVLLISCAEVKEVGGDIGGDLADVTICPLGLINCGQVWLCTAPSSNPDNIYGRIEICVDDADPIEDVEAVYGACEPTPRHQGLCRVCCHGECSRGANAFDGTWCPERLW